MPQPIDLKYVIGLPPRDAVAYFREKGYKFSWRWQEIWEEAHARAFTVAKVMRLDILQDIRNLVEEAINGGITYRQFQQELAPKLKAAGWWGKVAAKDAPGFDPASGIDPESEVQLGSPWRLKTIYRTNVQTAMMAGRYKGMAENVEERPYWQYVAILDRRTRPAHAALHNKVYRYDDPFWNYFYPPNGWGCRCRVRALTAEQVKEKELTVETAEGALTLEDRPVSEGSSETRPVAALTVKDVSGQPRTVSTDPGWSYNPGKAGFDIDLSRYDPDIANLFEERGRFIRLISSIFDPYPFNL